MADLRVLGTGTEGRTHGWIHSRSALVAVLLGVVTTRHIPVQLILFSFPTLVYLVIRRRQGRPWRQGLLEAGWGYCRARYFLWGIGVFAGVGVLTWLAFQVVPIAILQTDNVNTSVYSGWERSVASFLYAWFYETIYVALGEEVFFRGLLGGALMRRWGFWMGNAMQAAIFLLPHLLLLTISTRLWPLLVVQCAAGWLMGWLRFHSDSIWPSWIVHGLTNAAGALQAMA